MLKSPGNRASSRKGTTPHRHRLGYSALQVGTQILASNAAPSCDSYSTSCLNLVATEHFAVVLVTTRIESTSCHGQLLGFSAQT